MEKTKPFLHNKISGIQGHMQKLGNGTVQDVWNMILEQKYLW